jgi:TRAP-type C4-dicarboxylate transport system substrate-binding protein
MLGSILKGGRKMRRIFGLSFVAFLLVAFKLCGNGWAQQKPVTIIMENTYPPGHSRLGAKAVIGTWMDAVEENSKGMIKFDRHWAGEPVPAKESLDALTMGTLDMVVAFCPYFSGKIGIADVCAMPKNFMTFADVYDLWWHSPMGGIIDMAYQKKANAKFLFPAIFAPENFQIGKRAKKIRSFQDFKDLKIRAGGGAPHQTVRAIGGSPVQTTGGEYYTAMQRGTVDAGLMTTYSLETYKMWEVCDQVVNPPVFNHCFVGVWINLDKWKSLSPELQGIMIDSARKLETKWIAHCEMDDARIVNIAKKKGVEFYVLPLAEQEKMWTAVAPVWDFYIENCTKQGLGNEAKHVRDIVNTRFYSY